MSTVNPAQRVSSLTRAYCVSRCLHLVAEFAVADSLDDVPLTAVELAGRLGLNPGALHRMLRVLVSHGVFTLTDGRFSHNDASRLLRTGTPGSLRAAARTFGLPFWWNSYGALEHTLRTGRPATESAGGPALFDYLDAHPQEAGLFAEAMQGNAHALIPLILQVCDFRDARVVGDIGGGLGHMLGAVLATNSAAQGILFDRPEVIDKVRATAAPRIRYVAGDFFRDRIPACDTYLIMRVLHDWPDAETVAILANIRAGATAGARVLVIEGVLDESSPGPLAEVDIQMLVITGGQERSEEQWRRLLTDAGMSLRRIVPTASPLASVIEAVVP